MPGLPEVQLTAIVPSWSVTSMASIRSHALACDVSHGQAIAGHAAQVRIKIDHDAAEFPFVQLAHQLRDAITSGEFPPGRKLPSIDDIVKDTGLSPMTIRRAFKMLSDEGLVRIVPGRGTFVADRRPST